MGEGVGNGWMGGRTGVSGWVMGVDEGFVFDFFSHRNAFSLDASLSCNTL